MPAEDLLCVHAAMVTDGIRMYEGVCAGGVHAGMLCVANKGETEATISQGQVLAVAASLG